MPLTIIQGWHSIALFVYPMLFTVNTITKRTASFIDLPIQALVDSRSFREFKIDKRFYWTSGSIAGLNRGASGG